MIRTGLITLSLVGSMIHAACGGCEVRANDMCPYQCSIPGQAIILLDPSDTITDVPRRDARNKLVTELAKLDSLTELRVYTVRDAGRDETMESRFKMCMPVNPGSTSNPDAYEANYRRFHQELNAVLTEIFLEAADSESPIVEAVQAAKVHADTVFESRTERENFRRHIFFVSDMVQHSSDLSFFPQLPDSNDFPPHLGVDMSDFGMTVYFIRRRGLQGEIQQHPGFRPFWNSYSDRMGIQSSDLDWIEVTGGS